MKKIVILLLITIFVTFGCTRIPDSVETGVMPGEYKGLKNSDELKEENDSLSKDVEETKKQLDKLKEDYLSLAKSNDVTLKKLDESESLLKVLQDGGMPKFTAENTDKTNIVNYLNEKKALLDKSFRGLDILPLASNENIILFRTKGYGNYFNQLFIWEIGKKEPAMIEGAHFDIDGNWKWLLQDKFIIISAANNDGSDKIVVDVAEKKVSNTFKTTSEDVYLIPGTSSILMQKTINETSSFVTYDFLSGEEKELIFDFQNKNLKFKVNEENKEIIFTGTYKDANDTEYTVQAVMSISKLKEKYAVKAIEEKDADTNLIDGSGKSEDNEEGTV